MDSSLRNTPALLSHIDKLTGQLVSRFLHIIDLGRIPRTNLDLPDDENKAVHAVDRSQAGLNKLRTEVETVALIRAAEDILTLTRQMKEMWLFGQLDTLRRSEIEKKTEEDARVVAEQLGSLQMDALVALGIIRGRKEQH